jgi:hypothetical protein
LQGHLDDTRVDAGIHEIVNGDEGESTQVEKQLIGSLTLSIGVSDLPEHTKQE